MTDVAQTQQEEPAQKQGFKPFQKGQSGNPGGKPKNSRNRLQGAFLRELAADFDQFGKTALQVMRVEDPSGYIRTIASLMPKELEVIRQFEDLTDEQLAAAVLAARSLAGEAHFDPGAGTDVPSLDQSAEELQTVSETG